MGKPQMTREQIEDLQRKLTFAEACADPIHFDQMLGRVSSLLNKWAQADMVTLILPPEDEGLEPTVHVFGQQPVLPIAERSIRDDCASLLAEMDYAHLPGEALRVRRGTELTPLHGIIHDDLMYRFWWHEMRVDGVSVGIVALYGFVDWVLSPRNRRLLASIVPMLSRAVSNAASVEHMRMRMDRDEVTGLLNQRGVFEALDRECLRAEELGRDLSVMLCDIEGYAESAGTPEGDAFVGALAEVALSVVGTFDLVGRIGASEFVIIMPERDRSDAEALVDSLCSATEALVYNGEPAQLSYGLADFGGGSADAFLQAADQALFEFKRDNKVCEESAVG
jgi:diguanylate cyclase (GGDEF)-like protein